MTADTSSTSGSGLWDASDDFDDPPFDDFDDFDPIAPAPSAASDVPTPPAPTSDLGSGAPLPRARTAGQAVATSLDVDNGIQFGSDPDYQFLEAASHGVAFSLPDHASVLRTTPRTEDRRRTRRRTTEPANEPEPDFEILAAEPDQGGAPSPDKKADRAAAREERIAKARAERERKAQEKKAKREARAEEKQQVRASRDADRAVDVLNGSRARTTRQRTFVVAAAATAVLCVGGAAYAMTGPDSSAPANPAANSMHASSTAPEAPAAAETCASSIDGGVVTGRDPGGQSSGPDVIKAFNHAYYVLRDGKTAVGYWLPAAQGKAVGTPTMVQAAIDALPEDTTHCLKITDRGNGLYATELSEIPPGGGEPTIYRQLIQTVDEGGKTMIVSNTATY